MGKKPRGEFSAVIHVKLPFLRVVRVCVVVVVVVVVYIPVEIKRESPSFFLWQFPEAPAVGTRPTLFLLPKQNFRSETRNSQITYRYLQNNVDI